MRFQQVDATGLVWTFLDEARHPAVIVEGAIVLAADEVDPVLARVSTLTPQGDRTLAHLQIVPGDPLDYVDASAPPDSVTMTATYRSRPSLRAQFAGFARFRRERSGAAGQQARNRP